VSPGGLVVGIDHIQQLCDMSINNLRKDPVHAQMLDNGNIKIIKADGRLGWAECGAPFPLSYGLSGVMMVC
jgi:protein-L-isoaspartate(D-aspartate) O-methyltransferase